MQRIDHTTNVGVLPTPEDLATPGYFRQYPTSGAPKGTLVTPDWCNHIQEEIANVIEGAGITLDKTAFNQLFLAIQSLRGIIPGYLYGLEMLWVNANTIQMQTGRCVDATGAAVMEITSTQNVTLNTAVGINSIDAGTKANSTWYAVWMCKGASGTGFVYSTSFSAPTLPSGYTTYKRLVGAVQTDGSGNILKFYCRGKGPDKEVQWDVYRIIVNAVDGTSGTWNSTSTSGAYVPAAAPGMRELIYHGDAYTQTTPGAAGVDRLEVRVKGSTGPQHSTIIRGTTGGGVSGDVNMDQIILCDSSGDFEWRKNGTTTDFLAFITAFGFMMRL